MKDSRDKTGASADAGVRASIDEPATRAFSGVVQIAALPESFGRYRIRRLLGQGGMGAVYVAFDTQLDREVALKVTHVPVGEEAKAVARFKRSALAAAGVSHPNLCPILDVGEIQGIPYLTMPLLEGETLAARLKATPRFAVTEAVAIVGKLATAMAAAHDKGILHRDLTPANVMIMPDGTPVIMDFGLARRESASRMTSMGQVLGTPGYVAPETFNEQLGKPGQGADIFSLGVLLYELLTGELPFGRTMQDVLGRMFTKEPAAPSQHRPEISAAIDEVCLKAIARKPQDRYATMNDFADALARASGAPAAPRSRSGTVARSAVTKAPSRTTPAKSKVTELLARKERPAGARKVIIGAAIAGLLVVIAVAGFIARPGMGPTKPVVPAAKSPAPENPPIIPPPLEPVPIKTPSPVAPPAPQPAALEPGLIGAYYAGPFFQRRVAARKDAFIADEQINLRLPAGIFGQFYSARWTGYLKAPSAGSWVLTLESDDGSRLWLDDKLIIDGWYHHHRISHVAKATLTGKPQPFKLEYNQYDGSQGLRLAWRPVGGIEQTIPAEAFSHDPDAFAAIQKPPVQPKNAWSLRIAPGGGAVGSVGFVAGGGQIVTSMQIGRLQLWNATTGVAIREFHRLPPGPVRLDVAPDGRSFATAGPDDKIRIWALDQVAPLHEWSAHPSAVRFVAYLQDGKRVLSHGDGGALILWDIDSTKEIARFTPSNPATFVAISPDREFVAAAAPDGNGDLWEIAKPAGRRSLGRLSGRIDAFAISPGGTEFLRNHLHIIHRFRTTTLQPNGLLKGNLAWPMTMVLKADGRRLVTGGWDTKVCVYDWPSGDEVASFVGHLLPVDAVAISPDGRRIASGSRDGTVLLWDQPK